MTKKKYCSGFIDWNPSKHEQNGEFFGSVRCPANRNLLRYRIEAGNTTIDAEGRAFFYDGENKQKEVRNASNVIIGQYFYDGDGKRIKKISDAEITIFVYDAGCKLASEFTVSASQSQGITTSYLTNDTLGSPRITTDSTGNAISRRDFRPYGEEIYRQGQGTDKVRQKFTSYERDNETELDFAQARFYNSKLGRFNTVDPLMASADIINPQTFNRYVYVGNNPVNITDPTGEIWGTLGGSMTWYHTEKAMLAAGAVAATQLVGWIGSQMYALNPNANQALPMASAAAAIQQIVSWGASTGLVAGSLSALGVGAVAAAAIAANIACGAPCTNLYQANAGFAGNSARDYANISRGVYGGAAPKTIFDYIDSQGNILLQYMMNENKSSEEAAEQSTNTEANKPTSGKTEHGEQRSQEARQGDPNRNVGDPNRIKREGRRYRDTRTGNTIYVRGNRVTVYKPNGDFHSSFHNPKRNTRNRVNSGRWEPF